MATFWERAAHSVYLMFSLYFDLFSLFCFEGVTGSNGGAVAQCYSVGLRSERSRIRTPRPP